MRIAIWHHLPSGGGKRAMHDQVRGLVARGHHVESWCPPTADLQYLPLGDLIEEHVLPMPPHARSRLDDTLRLPQRVDYQLAAMDAHCRSAADAISRGGFDVLLAHPCLLFRSSPIAKYVRMPTVLYQQEPYRWLYEAMPRLPWLAPEPSARHWLSPRRWREIALDHRTIGNARRQARAELTNAAAFDKILVNSLFSRESILRAYGLDAEVCYLGTDVRHFVDHGLPREHCVVGLGAFSPEKNLRLVVQSLALLPAPRPELIWIGNTAYAHEIERVGKLAAARGVPFTPKLRIPDEEVIETLNRAAAMVYAPRLEPFGLAPIEAGACGVPIVAVAEGGVRETVIDGRTGLLAANDPQSIADAVGRLLADPALARRMGAAGRENAERNWSQEAATDRIEHALERARRTRASA